MLHTLSQFIRFIALFIGTGFIAGSIVHFGEGVTIWDVSVLIIGIILFITASYVDKYDTHASSPQSFALFIVQSLLLAIGIGMASGGTQHFVDTPTYAAVLIPLGLWIGLYAFFWREKTSMRTSQWAAFVPMSIAVALLLWFLIVQFDAVLPESIRVGHGSHGHGQRTHLEEVEDVHNHDDHH